ncbi:hypothetical protein AB4G91_09190 [Macrococcoides goetzii]|uniref:hypothetical protein n=1 Tax=Staphylococcaceae TaxID=90964 RepID=UPI001C5DE7F8|nr:MULTISPECIES: hypothetical protein [Macrococcus]MCH4985623.1 hypothetical protein [Macrococcus sp. PK]QYA45073.1 hypothetical protein KYI13_01705 [Macrococcus bohemicus]
MSELVKNSVRVLLKETFEGIDGKGSIYIEPKPDSGVLGTLKGLSVEEVSKKVNGVTIASITDHIGYYLSGINYILENGKPSKMDWEKSWSIKKVSDREWITIIDILENEYNNLMKNLDVVEWDQDNTDDIIAALVHSAYHLGALRQILKLI